MKKLLCICLIAVMLAAFTVCNGTSDESSGKKVVLNVHMNGDSVTIDPAFAYDNASSLVVDQITESLPTHNPDNALKPNLCKSFEATEPYTYVYQIRDNVTFSDGTPMTMDDVIYSIQRHLNADLGSYMNWFFANGIRDYGCLVTTWGADYPDPSANLDPLLNIANIDIGGYNCAAYSNAEVDSLLTKTVTTTDESKRMDLLFQACDIIIADEPYYVYNHTKGFAAFNKGWTLGDMSYTCAWDWNSKDVLYNG